MARIPHSSHTSQTRAYVAWLAVCLIWGTTYLAIRIALETVPVALLAGIRWLVAGALMVIVLKLLGHQLPSARTWPTIAVNAFLLSVVGNGMVVWAEQYVASGLAAVVVATVPFWSVFIETMRGRAGRLTALMIAGLLLGFLGIVVLVWPDLTFEGGARGFLGGILALQLACAGWALGSSYAKHHNVDAHPLAVSALQMLFGGIILIAIATPTGEWARLAFTPRTLGAMVYLTLVGSMVGYSSYIYALSHLPISTVSLYAYVNPIIAVVLGAVLLAEPFNIRIAFASALVLAGIALVSRKNHCRAIFRLSARLRPGTRAGSAGRRR